MLFQNKKGGGTLGGVLLIGLIMFNIIMFIFTFYANQSTTISVDSEGSIPSEIGSTPSSWFDGFRVSIYGFPDWFNYFYFTLQSVLLAIGVYYSILAS